MKNTQFFFLPNSSKNLNFIKRKKHVFVCFMQFSRLKKMAVLKKLSPKSVPNLLSYCTYKILATGKSGEANRCSFAETKPLHIGAKQEVKPLKWPFDQGRPCLAMGICEWSKQIYLWKILKLNMLHKIGQRTAFATALRTPHPYAFLIGRLVRSKFTTAS